MRSAKKRHAMAVLRVFLGLGQKELAALVGCSLPTIQSLETRRLKLSKDLALRIVDQTNVDFNWLMKDDPTAPLLNVGEKPYHRDDYVKAQARAWKRRNTDKWKTEEGWQIRRIIRDHQHRLGTLIEKASRKTRWEIVNWEVERALMQMESRYGIVHRQED
jgi:transcriptional regulator with XRE-family HTH domain